MLSGALFLFQTFTYNLLEMKSLYLVLFTTLLNILLLDGARAQYFLTPASGNSGIVIKNDTKFGNGLNYSITDSRFGFSTSKWKEDNKALGTNSNGSQRIQNSIQVGLNAGISLKESASDLFKSGNLTPGLDIAGDFVRFFEKHEKNGDDKGGFNSIFFRGKVAAVQKKFAKEDDSNKGKYELEEKTNVSLGGAVGWNTISEDEETFLIGFSAVVSHGWNSADTLKKKQVSARTVGVSQKNDTIYIDDPEDRYIGPWSSLTKVQLRGDGILKLGYIGGDRNNAMIGLMGAVSVDFGFHKDTRYNFAVGPTLNTSKKINETIAALLFEFNDATNALGKSPDFEDKFSVKAYIGIPFSILK